jgi:hypothetical protein
MIARPLLLSFCLLLSGCDLVDQLMADPKAIQREADAKAVGSACRHGMRSLEDCYNMNERASKAAIFTGWKDMDQYMRENKIDGVEPKGMRSEPVGAVASDEELVKEPGKVDKKSSDSKAKVKAGAPEKS